MHIGGGLSRQGSDVTTLHLAEILASTLEKPAVRHRRRPPHHRKGPHDERTFLGMPSLPVFGTGNLHASESFPKAAHRELGNAQLRANLGHATHTIRDKRLAVVSELPDWEQLRDAGSGDQGIRDGPAARAARTVRDRTSPPAAAIIHWARDADEANEIVAGLIRATGETEVVKVKSMATQEIGLNEYLEEQGIAAFETDLAELIVQLDHDKPSHILVPAIHKNRSQVRDIFLREMEGVDPELTNEPARLAAAARAHLRRKFLTAKVAVSGANFALADSGHPRRRRIRRQRPDVPDTARDADHRDGRGEAAAGLAGP